MSSGVGLDDALEVLDRAGDVVDVLGEHARELELDLGALVRPRLGDEAPAPQRDRRLDVAGVEREVGAEPQRLDVARRAIEERVEVVHRGALIAEAVQHGRALEEERHHLLIAREVLHLGLEPGQPIGERLDQAADVGALAHQLEQAIELRARPDRPGGSGGRARQSDAAPVCNCSRFWDPTPPALSAGSRR